MKSLEQIIKTTGKIMAASLIAISLHYYSCRKFESADPGDIQNTSPTITSTITDSWNYQCEFSKTQTSFPNMEDIFGRAAAAVEKDGIYYLCDFAKIEHIRRSFGSSRAVIYLRSGEQIAGKIVSNNELSNFYRDENNHLHQNYIYGLVDGKPKKIRISGIRQINFSAQAIQTPQESPAGASSPKYSKRVELKNSAAFTTNTAYIIDFCGHWWHSEHHIRNMPLDGLAELEFTGSLDGQQREVISRYKDGREKKDFLYLTSESRDGVCNQSYRFSDFDKMFVAQDYGAVLIPLNNVRKVILLEAEEK